MTQKSGTKTPRTKSQYVTWQVKAQQLQEIINQLPSDLKLFQVVHVAGAYYLVIAERA